MKAVSFNPLVARLAIELGLFEEEERGGLLTEHGDWYKTNVLCEQIIALLYCTVLSRAKAMKFLKGDDGKEL